MSLVQICFLWVMAFQYDGDCTATFEYKASRGSNNLGNTLELTLKEGASEIYAFDLYDLNTGNLVKSVSIFFATNQSKYVFENIPASTYVIYYSSAKCIKKKSIKGKGIILQ